MDWNIDQVVPSQTHAYMDLSCDKAANAKGQNRNNLSINDAWTIKCPYGKDDIGHPSHTIHNVQSRLNYKPQCKR